MTQAFSVDIVCDGNKTIGFGHVKRAAALAERLSRQNVDVRLLGLSTAAQAMLPPYTRPYRKPRITVFDAFAGMENEIRRARSENEMTVTLDWFGETVPDINIVIYPHKQVRSMVSSFVGFEYIIIRDEILSLPHRPYRDNSDKVLVCLGGGDLLGQTMEVAEILSNKGFEVVIIQGPLAPALEPGSDIPVHVNPPNFPELLNSCDWAVTNGGGCLFEALYLGKPAFVLPQTPMERKIADFSDEHDAVLGIGLPALRDFKPVGFRRISENGKKLVDGKGLDRIAHIITELL